VRINKERYTAMNENDAYRRLWSGENAAEPYLEWLARGDEGRSAREPFVLAIVDVMLSGDVENYELYSSKIALEESKRTKLGMFCHPLQLIRMLRLTVLRC